MKNNWNELKDIKAPQELKERTLAAAREARKLTNEPLHAVPRHPCKAPSGGSLRVRYCAGRHGGLSHA
jgi:hypothetical protein